MAEFHHGPEIIEARNEAGIVRDVRSAVVFIAGTAPVHELHKDNAADYVNKRIIVRNKRQAAEAFGAVDRTQAYTIPAALEAIFNKSINGMGGATVIVVNVFDPAVHVGNDGLPDIAQVKAADIVGGYDSISGRYTGLELAAGSYSEYGFNPKLIIAPGFAGNMGVRAAMDRLADKTKAMALVNMDAGITTLNAAIRARGVGGDYNTASERLALIWPAPLVYDLKQDKPVAEDGAAHLAGEICAMDLALGYQHSPSNKPLNDVMGLEHEVVFTPGEYDSDTNALNAAGIITFMQSFGTGFRFWGNRSAAFPTSSSQMCFINCRRVFDMVHEAALYYLLSRIDSIASANMLELIEDDVDAFIRKKVGESVLYGGSFRFDRAKTTSRDIADGHFYYSLDMQPVGIMERLTVTSELNINYAKEALGLSE
ncbi:phage tail sheath family protein [Candidatus Tokpelaia sp.]|uniref:phage tail sheath family protein n=1 Tax=Candidatus Tokpelaia sp. TaxID=2233777 RepID=UPI0012396F1E|nr:phage tail sheath subtilisin-like domain-containing protein [Candidatus Tokpelaia sp.]KAA6404490.1 phage tail protein [Candidatus Tokpelaia sp.]